jgi:hypothetical protein
MRTASCASSVAAEQWRVSDGTAWHNALKLRVWVCRSVEKHAAEQRVEQVQKQALKRANQSRRLVVEGLMKPMMNDR